MHITGREIFALHQSGKGVDTICKIMNNRGIRTTEGCKFHRTFIIRMFQKGWYYCGKFMYRLRTNKKPILLTAANIPETILTEEEFLRSHKIYGANARDNRKKHDDKAYIFKGKLRCAYCGTMLISNTAGRRRDKNAHDKVYRYYRCYHKREGQCNEAKYWTESGVDKVFLEFLKRFSSSKVEIDLETAKADEKEILNKKRLLEEQVFKEQNRKKKLQYLLLDEDISKDDFLRMSVEISEAIENLEREMAKLDADLAEIAKAENLEQQKAIAKSIAEEWENLDPIRKKEFLNAFVKTIFIGRDEIKRIDFIV